MPENDLPVLISWLVRCNMPDVLRIENLCFEFPWCNDDFLCCLRRLNAIGMVAENRNTHEVVGFMIYELNKDRIDLLNIAVAPKCQRRGVGSRMIERLVYKLEQQRRTEISATVRETNVDAQLFFRSQGFRVVSTMRGCFEKTDDDCYLFIFKQPLPDPLSPFSDRRMAQCGIVLSARESQGWEVKRSRSRSAVLAVGVPSRE